MTLAVFSCMNTCISALMTIQQQGRELRGEELVRQVNKWAEYGTIEPDTAEAIAKVWSTLCPRGITCVISTCSVNACCNCTCVHFSTYCLLA